MVSRLTMENSMWGVFHIQSALGANDTVQFTLPKDILGNPPSRLGGFQFGISTYF